MVCTRSDIAHTVGVVSCFLRYRDTSRVCLKFGENQTILDGYTNPNMAGDVESRKSTSGYLMIFAGGAVSRQSSLKKCVALSTMEAEYIATTD